MLDNDSMQTREVNISSSLLTCREDFFREEDLGICVPSCYTWKEYPNRASLIMDVVVFISSFIGLVSCLVLIIVMLIKHKRM